ncbi:MAG: ABC transporter [Gallionellales bacterium 35-53-114]|jgi:ATP-binding cassette subfamily B protein|nr:MAG: ABC transporter [Gallionellales bacterium 35-53-114]OYZ62499.1 MAG: ABC transporter [Gallionellales bacterium 24-53-125]OZB08558.1 MAG: ABC transporter [Gallionellales bacterium 39-52-133]HQS59530.1 ABC transporter ATP-binding protein [Gallionellaceae bacterium]HQS76443.1 ABC transporter ATP-binding protein [Gallionellaceae bacterium]
MHPLKRLFNYTRQYRSDVIIASIYSVLNKLFDILPEILIGIAVDVVVNQKASFLARAGIIEPKDQLLLLALITVIIWVLESLFEYLYELKWRNLAQNLQHDMRMEAYQHVQKLELAYFERNRTGNLLSILNEDINQMERFLNGGANDLIQVLVGSLMVGAVFFYITSSLAFLALMPIPFILYGAFWFQSRLAPRYTAVRVAAGALATQFNNNLSGIATVKAYTAEDFEAEHIRKGSNEYRARNAEAIRWSAAITPVIRMAILVGFTVTLLYGGILALNGEIGVGSYSVLVYLTQRLLWPLTRLAEMTDLYQRSMASIQRVMDLLHTPIAIPYEGKHLALGSVRGELEFEQVKFVYADNETAAIDGISLRIAAGESVAFVGSTGGGKSTLIKLLLRFYEPQQGQIKLDGQNIGELNLQDLRRAIGYVAQDTFLADASVTENIAYGTHGISQEEIINAAKAAEAHEFIIALPQGYNTQVGERGMKLSGGQRQRLALARAILKNPPILILDEATSAVDNETEAAIQRSLDRLVVGRTSLIIAHRLSTVRYAHLIHVLEGGRIVESGTHDELIRLAGSYAALWRLQTGER